jgi:hypothetical protein
VLGFNLSLKDDPEFGGHQMAEAADPIEKLVKMISKDRELLEEQLEKVKREYPLLALVYRIQQVVI